MNKVKQDQELLDTILYMGELSMKRDTTVAPLVVGKLFPARDTAGNEPNWWEEFVEEIQEEPGWTECTWGPSTETDEPKVGQTLGFTNVWETDDQYIITVLLPGVLKEDIKVSSDIGDDSGHSPFVRVEVKRLYVLPRDSEQKILITEQLKQFGEEETDRYITALHGLDRDTITATFINGVLEMRGDKLPSATPKDIIIE